MAFVPHELFPLAGWPPLHSCVEEGGRKLTFAKRSLKQYTILLCGGGVGKGRKQLLFLFCDKVLFICSQVGTLVAMENYFNSGEMLVGGSETKTQLHNWINGKFYVVKVCWLVYTVSEIEIKFNSLKK